MNAFRKTTTIAAALSAMGAGPTSANPIAGFFIAVGWIALVFAACYAIVMGSMCLAGVLLAKRTKVLLDEEILDRHVDDLIENGRVVRTKSERSLGRFYVVVLLAALAFFYLALPIVFAGLVLTFTVLSIAALFDRNRRGDELMLHSTRGGIKGVWKATFAGAGTSKSGIRKKRRDCPKLFEAIDEVAERIDTEAPDEVWIAPGAEFWVRQEGRGPFGAFGGNKRILTLGLCVMSQLTVSEFKSILAHEFAHFSHADTAWSRFLFQVTLSQRIVRDEMARAGGWIAWLNPFYWFFWCFGRSYDLLSAGFSRSHEFLADRMACVLYGSDVFAEALEKVCTDGSQFERVIHKNVVHHLKNGNSFVNMYHAFRSYRSQPGAEEARRKLRRDLLKEESSLFDSHPTFAERMDAGKLLPTADFTEVEPALTLFDDPEMVERELTDFMTQKIADRVGY